MRMRISYTPENDGRMAFTINSDSGNTYNVRYEGSGDGDPDYVATWSCTCPAAKYHPEKICKHIRAASEFNDRFKTESDMIAASA